MWPIPINSEAIKVHILLGIMIIHNSSKSFESISLSGFLHVVFTKMTRSNTSISYPLIYLTARYCAPYRTIWKKTENEARANK
jgi:hypothetical protein